MNARLQAELLIASVVYDVAPADILGRSRLPEAARARRAIWAKLLTRYPGGEFPAVALATAFGRGADIIRQGADMHLKDKPWKRRRRLKRKRRAVS